GRRFLDLSIEVSIELPLVLLEQAVAVVLGVSLEVDDPKAVRADREVDAGVIALGEDMQTGRFERLARDVVPARVRRVEASVDVLDERMAPIADAVLVHAPELPRQRLALDA